jgi:hypothetical protein
MRGKAMRDHCEDYGESWVCKLPARTHELRPRRFVAGAEEHAPAYDLDDNAENPQHERAGNPCH